MGKPHATAMEPTALLGVLERRGGGLEEVADLVVLPAPEDPRHPQVVVQPASADSAQVCMSSA